MDKTEKRFNKEVERFWTKVNITSENECWEWSAAKKQRGYGRLTFMSKQYLAHRVAYLITYGEFDSGLLVCHHCDNPSCVNPKHLFLGTHSDNRLDMYNKGRDNAPRGDRHRSRLHPESVPRGDDHWAKRRPELIIRGEGKAGAKLRAEQVLQMRREYGTGNYSYSDLSSKYGVDRMTIYAAVNRKTWSHIA